MSLPVRISGLLIAAVMTTGCSPATGTDRVPETDAQKNPKAGTQKKKKKKKKTEKQPLKIVFKRVSKTLAGTGYLSLEFQASNPTATKVPYVGYTSNSFAPPLKKQQISPIFRIEFKRKDKWENHPIGWCGTGIGPVAIEPKQTATFAIAVSIDQAQPTGKWDAVRVGIVCFPNAKDGKQKSKVAWSQPVSRKQLAKFEKK